MSDFTKIRIGDEERPVRDDRLFALKNCEQPADTYSIEPNVLHRFGECATLSLDFIEGNADEENEYKFSFISGETATVLTLPSSVKWVNELSVEANKQYEISIVDNIALWCAVDYTAEVTTE